MRRGLWGRFAVWTAFLVIIAAALYLSGVGTVAIVVVMFVAWLLVSAVEVALARAAARRHPQVVGRSVSALLDEAGPDETVRVIRHSEETEEALAQDDGLSLDTPPEEWPEPPAAKPVAPPGQELAVEAPPAAEPEPAAEPRPAPVAREPVAAEPTPELERVVPPAPPPAVVPTGLPPVATAPATAATEAPAAPPPAAPVARIGQDRPRAWNLWELERLAREVGGRDPARDEARSFLLLYLRDYATADGLLPVEFDPLVRESFADLTQR